MTSPQPTITYREFCEKMQLVRSGYQNGRVSTAAVELSTVLFRAYPRYYAQYQAGERA